MSYLSNEEMMEIQISINQKIDRISTLGLTFHLDDDLSKWREFVLEEQGGAGISKTIDPTVNDLRPGNSFWIYLENSAGEIVACQADRIIETVDFVQEYVCTHRLFGDRLPTVDYYALELSEAVPLLRGRINFAAGTWVHPDFRGMDISGLLSRMARMLALRHFLIDYFLGFIEATSRRREYGRQTLGMPHRRQLLSGRYPGRDCEMDVDIFWMNRHELLAQVSKEIAQ